MPLPVNSKPSTPSNDTPDFLRPFAFHGIEFTSKSGKQRIANCPLCMRDGRFFVNEVSGLWDCKKCGETGNITSFLTKFWTMADKATRNYAALSSSRQIVQGDTVMRFGAVMNPITGEWILPGYDIKGKIVTLYRYSRMEGKQRLLATPTLDHGLHFADLPTNDTDTVFITEGPWDAMVLWEVFNSTKVGGSGYQLTASPNDSLNKTYSVLGPPGCNVWKEQWNPLVRGRNVVICFDSDYPKTRSDGIIVPPAGWANALKLRDKLTNVAKSVRVILWGPDGYDPNRPAGYDLRDYFKDAGPTIQDRINRLQWLLDRVEPFPSSGGSSTSSQKQTTEAKSEAPIAEAKPTLETMECYAWADLNTAWRKAMKWPDSGVGLDHALACMMATITSTRAVGDQLWMKIIGPASCGKSTLCEGISVARNYVLAKSTIRGFHSGFGQHEGEDNSLLAQLNDKTLVTKDGDTLLQSPNLGQILSEARDIYDRVSRTHYRNKMSKDYEGINMTWLLCGTSSLRSIDSSELGERFLDCVIMEEIDEDTEDEILNRVAEKANDSMALESTGDASSQYPESLRIAMQLTGGYIEYLRTNSQRLLSSTILPEPAKDKLKSLAKFVSYMRARPSTRQDEQTEREFSARLLSQLLRLSKCLAVVLNKEEIDDAVMERVTKVAKDTARGKTLEIALLIHNQGKEGMVVGTIEALTNRPEAEVKKLLRFLRSIKAVTVEKGTDKKLGRIGRLYWKLTPRMSQLVTDVYGPPDPSKKYVPTT